MTTLPWDVILDPTPDTDDGEEHLNLGLILNRVPGQGGFYRIDSDPGAETTEDPVYMNSGGGAGYTEQYVPGTTGYGRDVDDLTWGVVLPAGKRTEITDGFIGYADGLTCTFDWGADLYLCVGRAVYKIANGTSTTMELVKDLGPGVAAQSAVEFDGAIYVGTYVQATGAAYLLFKFDGTTWTTGTANRRHLAVVEWDPNGNAQRTLVGTPNVFAIQWVAAGADPLDDGDWTSALTIGSSIKHIRKLIEAPRHIWAAKQEGVFDIVAPSDNAVHANLTPHWKQTYDIENGAAGCLFDDSIYVAHAFGLDRIPVTGARQDMPVPCEFGAGVPFSGPIYGRPVAVAPSRWGLLVAYYNPTENESYVMIGRPRAIDSELGPLEWRGAYSVVTGRITFIGVRSPLIPGADYSYLWIGATDDSDTTYHVHRQYMSKASSNYQELLAGGSPEFQTSFEVYWPDGWGAPTSRRVPYRYDVHADRLGGGAQVSIYANHDRALSGTDPEWVLQGVVASSPRTSFIPASLSDPAYRIDFKVVGQGDTYAPPVLRAFQPLADVNREQAPIYAFEFWVEDYQAMRNGSSSTYTADWVIETLWSLQSDNATPVTMVSEITDNEIAESVIEVLPGVSLGKRENRDGRWGRSVTVRIRFLYGVWYWDSGVTYDSGRFWG